MDDRPQNGITYQGRLDIVSDAICPWCYIGKRQLERAQPILGEEGLRFSVHWNPFQLNPDMPREGVDRRAYRTAKFGSWERSQELDARVAEAAAAVGLTFRLDRLQRTPNTVDAHRLVWLAGEQGVQDAAMEAVFRAYFTEGGDLGDRELLADCAAAAGMERDAVFGFLAGEALESEVREADRTAREAGVNGVPSFFLDGYGLFSGALPAEQIATALSRAHAVLAKQRGSEAA
jgi:predicted DsbA family dithiol-disulfide isomerase